MSEITELILLKAKLKFLGYKSGIEKLIINNSYAPLIKELQKLSIISFQIWMRFLWMMLKKMQEFF